MPRVAWIPRAQASLKGERQHVEGIFSQRGVLALRAPVFLQRDLGVALAVDGVPGRRAEQPLGARTLGCGAGLGGSTG